MLSRATILAIAISLSACGGGGSTGDDAAATGSGSSRAHTVFIHDYAYLPQTLTIAAGDTVIFKNLDEIQHSADGAGWSTGDLDPDGSTRIVLPQVGEYRYSCAPHPGMLGRIVVQ